MNKFTRFLCMMAIAMMPFLATGQNVVDTVPYHCDFEDTVQNSHWHLVNGACYNYFVIDTSANATPDGMRSLYVTESEQLGTPYSYKPGSPIAGETSYVASRVFAWIELNFPDTGLYDIGYWWNCMGEDVYDYGRVILAPSSYTFTASTADWDTSSPYAGQYLGAVSTPSNCISLNGTSPLSNVTSPQYRTQTVHITTAGNYRLGIMWLNDGNTGDQPPLMIDDIDIALHTCDVPSHLMVDHFSNDSVFLTWDNVAPAYVVMWDTAGVTGNFTNIETVYTNSYVIGGLPENGEYEFVLSSLCGTDASMQTSYHIVMPDNSCAPITSLPYTLNFDTITSVGGSTTPPDIPCWGHLTNASNNQYAGYPYLLSSYAHTGSYSLYFYYTNMYVTRCGYHLPRLDNTFDITGVVVSFWAANSSTSYHPHILVGVMSDPSNINSFVACDTLSITSNTTTQYVAPLSNYMGNGRYVAILMGDPAPGETYSYVYMDDIVLSYEPCSRPGVTSLVVTDTSAHIEWAPTNGYYYEWTMSLADTATVTRENDTVLDLTGLSPSTQYTLYIRSVCDDPGAWNPVTFRTECGPIRALPFFDDLEGSTGGTSTTPGAPFVECWKRVSDATSYEYPYISTGSAHSGSRYIYWYRSNTAGSYGSVSYIVMPGIDTNYISMNDVVVKFWAMSSSTSYGPTVEVGVMNSQTDTASFRRVAQVDILDASYRQYAVPLANYTDTGTYVALRARHNGQYWYCYFDDFSFESIPSCPQIEDLSPVGVGTTSAYVSWGTSASIDSVTTYEISVIDADSTISPITFLTTETGYFVTGLAPHTSYTISVRAICDTSNSEWSSVDVVTSNLPCIEFDTSTRDSLVIGLGMGSTSNYTVPVNNYWQYSYTQQLISASEMNGAAVITGIDFQYGYSSSMSSKTNCTIYLSNTTTASLSSAFVPYSATTFTNVYTGTLNCVNGWNHFEFTTPFAYDGTSNLLITVHDNSGDYQGTSYVFNCHNTSGTMTRYLNQDGTPYTITSISGGSTATYRSNMRLHTQGCGVTGNCASPNVVVDNVTPDEISIIWAAGSTETTWNVEYQALGDTSWIDEGTLSSTSYTLTGLNSNTTYNIRVTALCSSTETPTATVSATTTCDGYPIPFFEDFSTWGTSSTSPIPACWYKNSTYNANYPYTNSSYNHSGSPSRAMYFYNNGSLYSCIILPKFNVPVDSLEISFYMLKQNTSYPHALRVGVMTDPNDMSTFELIEEVQPGPAANQWYGVSVTLNNYTGRGEYIAIRTAPGYNYPYVDDISVTRFNPCVRPSHFSVDNVVSNSATIHWEDTITDNFEVEWGPTGFTRGTGTTLSVTADSVVLTGLAVNTQYDIYVRGLCTDDTGYWTMPFTFWSECLRIDSLPFLETFETYPSSDSYNPDFVHCWTRLCGASYFYPYVSSSSSYNHTPGGNRGMYWYCTNSSDYYYGTTMSEYIVLPEVDTTVLPINNLMLSFWATQSSGTLPYIAIGVMSDPSDPSTFVAVDTVVVSSGSWTQFDVPLNRFNGYGSYVALRGFYVSYWYAYVDDISLDTIPSCMKPNHFTSTGNTLSTVDLAWNERSEATLWQISYDTAGAATPSYDTIVSGSPATTIGGLFAGQRYTFRVRSICSVGDTSEWSDPINVAPGAWNMRPNMTDTLHACQAVVYDDGGPDNQYSDGQNSLLIIYPDAPGNLINLSGSYNLESCCDYINVYDGVGTGGTQLLATSGTSSGAVGPFLSTSGPMTIQFHTDGSVHSYNGFEIMVSCLSTTCGIFNLSLDTTTAQSATQLNVTWDTNGALVYEVEYGPHGFIQGTGTSLTTTLNHVILTGLDTLTSYDVYVRSICDGNDTGSWSRETFTTSLCENSIVATNCNGDGTTTTSYFPAYATYNYSYSEVIIDSADMAGSSSIIAWAFKPTQIESGSSYHTNCTVYMAHTTLSDLSTAFIQDTATFQKVFTGSLNHSTTEWQVIRLDSSFVWDGHSNVVVAVDRRHGSWTSSGYFAAFNASSSKARYIYQDSGPYNMGTISGGYATSTVPVYRFFSCGGATCDQPIITSITHDYSTATVTWIGSGTNYEVNVKESAAPNWPDNNIPVVGNSYTFTGLNASTNYMFRVRQDCTADSIGYSDWVIDGFLTDSLPCFPPDSLHVTAVTNADATFDWNVNGNENVWDIHVWYGSFDSTYRVITRPATVGGFTAGLTYNAAIRAVCGVSLVEGDWSDTIQFSTAVCPDVTGLSTSNVTSNSVTLNWNANPMAQSYMIEYGYAGFTQGSGTQAVSSTNSYVATGLLDGVTFDFYVKAVCGDDWTSENWTGVSATTQEGTIPCDAPTGVNTTVADNSVTVNWTAGTGNISFEIEYGPHGFSHGAGVTTNATSSPAVINNLEYETGYDLYVRAICEQNTYSPWSSMATFTTGERPSEDCDPVQNLNVDNVAEHDAEISWQPGSTGDRWQVVLTDENGATVSDNVTTETHASLSGLDICKNYSVKVRTVCGDDNYSAYVTANFRTIGCEGIDDVDGISCRIFPNPATSSTTISVSGVNGKVRIAVVDMNGRTVATETLECSSDCEKTMEVDKLAQGAYFVRITADNTNMVRKLIVR